MERDEYGIWRQSTYIQISEPLLHNTRSLGDDPLGDSVTVNVHLSCHLAHHSY